MDPSLIPLAVSRVWHSDPDIHLLLDQVLPDTAEAYSQALAFLADAQDPAASLEVWRRLIAKDPHTEWKWAFALTDMLVDTGKIRGSRSSLAPSRRYEPRLRARLCRAIRSFTMADSRGTSPEADSAGGKMNVGGADFDFDTDEKHSGSRSARLMFDGTKNLAYQDLFQYVLVSPATHYRFQGFLRTDQISTESGMRFEILDPKDQQHLDVLTPNETGTLPWTLEQVDFTTGPQTHVILIRLARRPSERLDNKLRGTVWIDDVSLCRQRPPVTRRLGRESIRQDRTHAQRAARQFQDGGNRFQMLDNRSRPGVPRMAAFTEP